MSLKVTFGLKGHKELTRRLNRFNDSTVRKIIERSMRKSIRPIMAAVRAAAPKGPTGNLRRSLTLGEGVVIRRYKGAAVLVFGAGRIAPHAHLVEEGTAERFTKTGASRGKMPALHMFRDAFEANAGAIDGILTNEIAAGIMREA